MHYKSLFKKIHEKPGSLSATEAFSVDSIYLLNEPTIKQFADYLGISQPNATYKINSLIEKGYIKRVPSKDDKREFRLCMADKFYKYYETRISFIDKCVDSLEKAYSSEELSLFADMLDTLAISLESE